MRSLLPVLPALLLACGEPAVLAGASPAELRPGQPLRLIGTGFDEDLTVVLRREVDAASDPPTFSEPLTVPVVALSPTEATLDLPDDLPPGRWLLAAGAELPIEATGPTVPTARIEVWTPATDPPCKTHYALDVSTHRTRREVTLRRVLADGAPEVLTFTGDDLDGLLLGTTGRCAWLRLTTTDGTNPLVFDGLDAADRAQRIAANLAAVLELPMRQP